MYPEASQVSSFGLQHAWIREGLRWSEDPACGTSIRRGAKCWGLEKPAKKKEEGFILYIQLRALHSGTLQKTHLWWQG